MTMTYLLKYADDLLTLLPPERRKHYSKRIKIVPDVELFDVIRELEKETWDKRPSDLEVTVDSFISLLQEFNCIEE
jgi:hypothetical protein